MSEQRFTEQEVHSILRDAVRLTPTQPSEGITREQLERFASEAGITPEALEQSIRNHQTKRSATLLKYLRKTTLTLDWELSRSEIDNIAAICEALPPYLYRTTGNYDVIRLDRWGFFSVISILRREGFTHISIDRQYNLEFCVGLAVCLCLLFGSFASGFTFFASSSAGWTLATIVGGLFATLLLTSSLWFFGNRSNARKRDKFAREIAQELGAQIIGEPTHPKRDTI